MSESNSPIIEDWWTEPQIELVTDASKNWQKQAFKTTSDFWTSAEGGKVLGKTSQHDEIPPGAKIDNTAWDHEHCGLCRETISDQGEYQREGYTDGNDWLCIACYNKYIAPQHL